MQISSESCTLIKVSFWLSMKCVICKKEIQDESFVPFCSSRCRNIDLNRWFDGEYVISADDFEEESVTDPEGDS